jgi:5-methylcytosine-specific restriction endonuclease McrA
MDERFLEMAYKHRKRYRKKPSLEEKLSKLSLRTLNKKIEDMSTELNQLTVTIKSNLKKMGFYEFTEANLDEIWDKRQRFISDIDGKIQDRMDELEKQAKESKGFFTSLLNGREIHGKEYSEIRIKAENEILSNVDSVKYKNEKNGELNGAPTPTDEIFSQNRRFKELKSHLEIAKGCLPNAMKEAEEKRKETVEKRALRSKETAQKRKQEKEKEEKKYGKKEALAAAHLGEGRLRAKQIRDGLEISYRCPYCGGNIGSTPHADHIYPLSLGGLSTDENMIFACSKCNLKKKDDTLRKFIQKNNLNRDKIEARLEKMGKSF